MPPNLRVLPRSDLQASHLGGSLETSFENYLWIRGGWLIRACSHNGYQALVAPSVPQVRAHIALIPVREAQAKSSVEVLVCDVVFAWGH